LHILFGAALSAQPDRSSLVKIGDNDGIGVTLMDGYFIDANGPKLLRRWMLLQQATHVAFLHATHLIPTQVIKLCYTCNGHLATELSNAVFEPLSEPGRLGQHGKGLALHGFALGTGDPAILKFKIDAGCSGIQVSYPMSSPVPIA
jgi:hypothetical protein